MDYLADRIVPMQLSGYRSTVFQKISLTDVKTLAIQGDPVTFFGRRTCSKWLGGRACPTTSELRLGPRKWHIVAQKIIVVF